MSLNVPIASRADVPVYISMYSGWPRRTLRLGPSLSWGRIDCLRFAPDHPPSDRGEAGSRAVLIPGLDSEDEEQNLPLLRR